MNTNWHLTLFEHRCSDRGCDQPGRVQLTFHLDGWPHLDGRSLGRFATMEDGARFAFEWAADRGYRLSPSMRRILMRDHQSLSLYPYAA